MKKSRIITLLILVTAIFCICNISSMAAVKYTTFDWESLGVTFAGKGAIKEDYYGEGVNNLRCAYSSWDSAQEYLWLISQWPSPSAGTAYLGDNFDMTLIESVSFDYVNDGSSNVSNNKVSLTSDAEGSKVIATCQIPEPTGALKDPKNVNMEILDPSYKGPLYIYIEYGSRMFVGNLVFASFDDGTSPTPKPTATPDTRTPVKTPQPSPVPGAVDVEIKDDGNSSSSTLKIILIVVIVVLLAGSLLLIWGGKIFKKKKK